MTGGANKGTEGGTKNTDVIGKAKKVDPIECAVSD